MCVTRRNPMYRRIQCSVQEAISTSRLSDGNTLYLFLIFVHCRFEFRTEAPLSPGRGRCRLRDEQPPGDGIMVKDKIELLHFVDQLELGYPLHALS